MKKRKKIEKRRISLTCLHFPSSVSDEFAAQLSQETRVEPFRTFSGESQSYSPLYTMDPITPPTGALRTNDQLPSGIRSVSETTPSCWGKTWSASYLKTKRKTLQATAETANYTRKVDLWLKLNRNLSKFLIPAENVRSL